MQPQKRTRKKGDISLPILRVVSRGADIDVHIIRTYNHKAELGKKGHKLTHPEKRDISLPILRVVSRGADI